MYRALMPGPQSVEMELQRPTNLGVTFSGGLNLATVEQKHLCTARSSGKDNDPCPSTVMQMIRWINRYSKHHQSKIGLLP